ncbi:MAG: hypothetical protein JWR75_2012 [Devosia sp.]|nr:hypothetical protein [Devosia sp.]
MTITEPTIGWPAKSSPYFPPRAMHWRGKQPSHGATSRLANAKTCSPALQKSNFTLARHPPLSSPAVAREEDHPQDGGGGGANSAAVSVAAPSTGFAGPPPPCHARERKTGRAKAGRIRHITRLKDRHAPLAILPCRRRGRGTIRRMVEGAAQTPPPCLWPPPPPALPVPLPRAMHGRGKQAEPKPRRTRHIARLKDRQALLLSSPVADGGGGPSAGWWRGRRELRL